jgi:two-component system LytT family response regulator
VATVTYEKKDCDNYFFVKSGKTWKNLLLDSILYFEGEKEYVRVVSAYDELLIYRRLKEIEEQLQAPFIRVHHSYIVNIKMLDKVQDNHIYIGSKQIPISDKFRNRFMEMIRQRAF